MHREVISVIIFIYVFFFVLRLPGHNYAVWRVLLLCHKFCLMFCIFCLWRCIFRSLGDSNILGKIDILAFELTKLYRRESLFCIVTRLRAGRSRVRFTTVGKIFFSFISKTFAPALRAYPDPNKWAPDVKLYFSSPKSDVIKKAWSFTTTLLSPLCFHGVHRDNVTFDSRNSSCEPSLQASALLLSYWQSLPYVLQTT